MQKYFEVLQINHESVICPVISNPVIPWNVAFPSMEFFRQEYWSVLPFPSPRDPPQSGTEPRSPVLQPNSLLSEPPGKPCTKNGLSTKILSSLC